MKKNIAGLIVTTFMAMALLIGLFASCNPQKKLAKAEATLSAAGVLPKICADRYPVKVEYIKGDSVLTFDTIYVGGIVYDTTTVETKDTVYKTITKTLPAKVVTKTVKVTDTLVKENTARVIALQAETAAKEAKIISLQNELNSWRSKAKQRFNWLIVLLILVGGYTILRVKKILNF